MKLMNALTKLILTVSIAPALVLSTSVVADDLDYTRANSEQGADELFMNGKTAESLYAGDVIGMTIKHRESGDDVGKINDLIIGADGYVVAVVITAGGIFGIGGYEVSLGWSHLERTLEDNETVFYVNINEKTLKGAPKYKRD